MGSDIGYLQNKIRELQEKNEQLDKKITDSLNREKRLNDNLLELFAEVRDTQIETAKREMNEALDTLYREKFEKIFLEQAEKINEDLTTSIKSFNQVAEGILQELAKVNKDMNFLVNLFVDKLKISKEEFKKFCENFDDLYPAERTEKYLSNFKLKIINGEKRKRILKNQSKI